MDTKKYASSEQVKALMDYMQQQTYLSGLEKKDREAQWESLTKTLNSMASAGGAVKSIEKWKQTYNTLKSNSKKKKITKEAGGMSSNGSFNQNTDNDNDEPARKRFGGYLSFDEEIIKIEREKLELEREYKIQKIEALSRIAAALEDLASKS